MVAGGYHLRTDRPGRHRGYTFNLSRPRIGYGNGQGGAPTLMYCRVATPVVSRCKPYDAGLLGSPFRRWCLHVKSRYGVHPSEVFLDFSDARDVFSSDPQRLALPLVGDGARELNTPLLTATSTALAGVHGCVLSSASIFSRMALSSTEGGATSWTKLAIA